MKVLKIVKREVPTEMEVRWIRKNWTNGKGFVAFRKNKGPICKCCVCGESLDVDEMVHLVSLVGSTNRMLHDKCLQKEDTPKQEADNNGQN